MKKDTQQKSSPFLRKRAAFSSGISLHFLPFVVRYGFNMIFAYIIYTMILVLGKIVI